MIPSLLSLFFVAALQAQAQPQNPIPAKPLAQAAVAAKPSVSPSPTLPAVVKASPSPSPSSGESTAMDAILSEDLIKSLRDPFQVPAVLLARKEIQKTDLELYPLKDFKLNGVVSGPKKARAMLTAPNNKVYFVKVGDAIGVREGKVTQIMSDAIKITEYFINERGKKYPDVYELKLSGELVSLTKKEEE